MRQDFRIFFVLQDVYLLFPLIYHLMMENGKSRHPRVMFSKLPSVYNCLLSRSLLQSLAETARRAPEVIHPGANISLLLQLLYPGRAPSSAAANKLLCQSVLHVQLVLRQAAPTKITEHFRKMNFLKRKATDRRH